MSRTYNTAVTLPAALDERLVGYAALHSRIERTLHADLERQAASGVKPRAEDFKTAYCSRFQITARQFNAIAMSIKGRRASITEINRERVKSLSLGIRRAQEKRRLALKSGKTLRAAQLHDKVERLRAQQTRLKADLTAHRVRMCFGTRKFFNAQLSLGAGSIATHEDWRRAWQSARSSQFYCLGSKDESAGNQTCTARQAEDGSFTLRVRLPDALIKAGEDRYVIIPGVRFSYGQEDIEAGLERGSALSYRFMRDAEKPGRWRVALTLDVAREAPSSIDMLGRIGVDVNVGFLLAVETDRFGNKVRSQRLSTPERGLSAHQREAARGEAIKALISWAHETSKPIVLEDLDLARKKSGRSADTNRKISALAYKALRDQIEARAADAGVLIHVVNPAYSSVQGRTLAVQHGLTTHGGAAFVLARRSQGYRQRLPKVGSRRRLPTPDGLIWWSAPARMHSGGRTDWTVIAADISQVLAAQYRSRALPAKPSGPARVSESILPGGIPGLEGVARPHP